LRGAVVLAPHILVEDISVTSIEQARQAYLQPGLKEKLARYHDDVDSAFWGWNDIWLAAAFRTWSIEEEIRAITCPLLAIQGLDDEYGTLEQVRGIARRVPQARVLELPDCGHSPHKDQPRAVIDAVTRFLSAQDL
jgi:pimeloyl-ACP methyl ester carboxylesterase